MNWHRIVGPALFVLAAAAFWWVNSLAQLGLTRDGEDKIEVTRSYIFESISTPQFLLSAVLLAAGLFVILSKRYTPQDKHWAYGVIGTIVGVWLK